MTVNSFSSSIQDVTLLSISTLSFLLVTVLIVTLFHPRPIHTKANRPNPPKPHNVTEWDPIPQGSLVKVKTPEDPMFGSRWDGLTGFVIGVSEDGVWYNVMFVSKESVMTYQVFKRSDLEYIRDVN